MQDRINPNHKVSGPLGIRASVWLIICGVLLTCVLLLIISGRPASPSAGRPGPAGETAVRNDSTLTPSHNRPIHPSPPPPTVSEVATQSAWPQASPAISNELSVAREKLQALRGNYGDEHPDVKEQVRAVESLERSTLTGETLELAKARAEFAKLQVRYGPEHPDRQAQGRFVESLEQSAAANDSSELAQAKAQLAKLRLLYGEGHPEVQAQLKRVAETQQ